MAKKNSTNVPSAYGGLAKRKARALVFGGAHTEPNSCTCEHVDDYVTSVRNFDGSREVA
jgi:hypothetical protein